MPIQQLGDLSGLYGSLNATTTPLEEIEKRRIQRKAESQKDTELGIKAYGAMTDRQNASTLSATEARKAKGEEDIRSTMKELNAKYGPTAEPGTPEYLDQKYRYATMASQSQNPDVAKLGNEMLGQFERDIKGAQPGSQSAGAQMYEAQRRNEMAQAKQAEATAQYYGSFPEKQAPQITNADLAEVENYLKTMPENQSTIYKPWTWWNGVTDEERYGVTGKAKVLQEQYRKRGQPISIGQAAEKVMNGEEPMQMAQNPMPQTPAQQQAAPAQGQIKREVLRR